MDKPSSSSATTSTPKMSLAMTRFLAPVPSGSASGQSQVPMAKSTKHFLKRVAKPKVEPEYSEIDFTKYAAVYNEIMLKDFGSSQRLIWNPPRPRPQGATYERTPPEDVPSPLESDHSLAGVDVDIHTLPLPSNHLESSQPPVPVLPRPPPIVHEIDSTDLYIASTQIHLPPTPLPTWVNRNDWEEKKMRKKLRHELEELQRRRNRHPIHSFVGPTEQEIDLQRRKEKLEAWRKLHPKGTLFNQPEPTLPTFTQLAAKTHPHPHRRRTSKPRRKFI